MTIRESKPAANASANVDAATVVSFGDEWSHFDQSALSKAELAGAFSVYFKIFPWDALPDDAEGFVWLSVPGVGLSWWPPGWVC
jgi:hypothetical protein